MLEHQDVQLLVAPGNHEGPLENWSQVRGYGVPVAAEPGNQLVCPPGLSLASMGFRGQMVLWAPDPSDGHGC